VPDYYYLILNEQLSVLKKALCQYKMKLITF